MRRLWGEGASEASGEGSDMSTSTPCTRTSVAALRRSFKAHPLSMISFLSHVPTCIQLHSQHHVMSTYQPSRNIILLDLPNEILALIFDVTLRSWTVHRKDILNLRSTCKRLYEVSEPAAYRYIELSAVFDPDDRANPLNTHHDRGRYVQHLVIVSIRGGQAVDLNRHPDMPQSLVRIFKLKTLRISDISRSLPNCANWCDSLRK